MPNHYYFCLFMVMDLQALLSLTGHHCLRAMEKLVLRMKRICAEYNEAATIHVFCSLVRLFLACLPFFFFFTAHILQIMCLHALQGANTLLYCLLRACHKCGISVVRRLFILLFTYTLSFKKQQQF